MSAYSLRQPGGGHGQYMLVYYIVVKLDISTVLPFTGLQYS